MAKFNFTATHGVTLQDKDGVVWAQFVDERSLAKPDGTRTYVFGTDDAKVADRVRKLDEYGVAESKTPAED